jgi:hypothetical protein
MHLRIRALIRAKFNKEEDGPKKRTTNSSVEDAGQVTLIKSNGNSGAGAPPDTVWEMASDLEAGGDKLWKGTAPGPGGKPKVFFFRGPQAPQFDPIKQSWASANGTPIGQDPMVGAEDSGAGSFLDQHPDMNSPLLQAVQEGLKSEEFSAETGEIDTKDLSALLEKENDADFDWNAAASEIEGQLASLQTEFGEDDLPSDGDLPPDSDSDASAMQESEELESKSKVIPLDSKKKPAAAARKSLLRYSMERAVQKCTIADSANPTLFKTTSKVSVMIIQCARFNGYIVNCNASNSADPKLLKAVYEKLRLHLADDGVILNPIASVIELDFDPIEFKIWAAKQAEAKSRS